MTIAIALRRIIVSVSNQLNCERHFFIVVLLLLPLSAIGQSTINVLSVNCDSSTTQFEMVPFIAYRSTDGASVPVVGQDWNSLRKIKTVKVDIANSFFYGDGKVHVSCHLKNIWISVSIAYIPFREKGQCAAAPYGVASINVNGKELAKGLLIHNCMEPFAGRIRFSQLDGWQTCRGKINVTRLSQDPENSCETLAFLQ